MKKTVDPRMHSAEHILNQTMDRIYGCGRCFSAHVEKKKSKCDYRFDHALSDAETRAIELQVNEIIGKNLQVMENFITLEKAQSRYNLGKLPPDAGDRIRIVKIGDYDACPCIGPHVEQTRDIGSLHITSTDFKEGVLRIRFKLSYAD
jgi:misacylated tRNA(Ala) deacylase